jgi:hypothetical protein
MLGRRLHLVVGAAVDPENSSRSTALRDEAPFESKAKYDMHLSVSASMCYEPRFSYNDPTLTLAPQWTCDIGIDAFSRHQGNALLCFIPARGVCEHRSARKKNNYS